MSTIELARLVAAMRSGQREYFRTRSAADLDESRRLEKRVDKAIESILTQPMLKFTDPEAPQP